MLCLSYGCKKRCQLRAPICEYVSHEVVYNIRVNPYKCNKVVSLTYQIRVDQLY